MPDGNEYQGIHMDTYPPIVQGALANMAQDQQLTFQSEYARRKKSMGTMVLATVFFVHFFVYGKVGMGIVYWLTAWGFMFWWVIELLLIGKRLNDHNNQIAMELAREMSLMEKRK